MPLTAVILALAVALPLSQAPSVVPEQERPKFLKRLLIESRERDGESSRSENVEAVAEIERMIDRIGVAFDRGDVELLEDTLAARKIYISLRSRGGEAGYKGRPQIKFMFAKLFAERQTKNFLYDSSSVERAEDGSAFFRADWTYVVLDEDDVVTEHLRFKLERTKPGWRVVEILAGSR